jgi:hypothetical protein
MPVHYFSRSRGDGFFTFHSFVDRSRCYKYLLHRLSTGYSWLLSNILAVEL